MILTLALSVMVVVEGIVIIRLSNKIEMLRDRLLKQMRMNTTLKNMRIRRRDEIELLSDSKDYQRTMPIEMTEVIYDGADVIV